MGITLYTTRVVLQVLGVVDYGIYNTLASVVVLFSFINQSMITTTQRFLNFYIGKNEKDRLTRIFSISLIVHVLIGIIIVILTEIIGMWFLHYKMNLPSERFYAAFWTLQLSILITFINIIRSPYNACIIAFEKMDFYAYISIIEVLMKLGLVFLIKIIVFDKLIIYNILLTVTAIVILLCYKIYCNQKYEISKFKYVKDNTIFKDLLSFSGYSLLGNAANVFSQQGINMIINSFLGVIANAAIGMCNQVHGGVYSFAHNFQVAFNPSLVKTYAKNDIDSVKVQIIRFSKFSYFLLFIIMLPLFIYCSNYLNIWLSDVPQYTKEIVQITLIDLIITAVQAPLWTTVQASGNIKTYQIIISILVLLNIPIAYICLKFNYSIVTVFTCKMVVNFITYMYRLWYVHKLINLSILNYARNLIFPILSITLLSLIPAVLLYVLNINFILSTVLFIFCSAGIIYFIGLSHTEKLFIRNILKSRF